MMTRPTLRRWLLAGLATALPLLASTPALAEATKAGSQVPGYYRMMVGEFELTALFDGVFALDVGLLKNATPEKVAELLAAQLKAGPQVQTAVNAYLVNTGKHLVLVDAGAATAFGPTLGMVLQNLKASGYTPEQVDTVLLTHLHADHAAGLLGTNGKPAFPNAIVHVAKSDADFWLPPDALAKADEGAKPFFQMAQASTAPYIATGKWKVFGDDAEIVPGITTQSLPGHTPGHSGFLLSSGNAKLLIWGDIIHNAATQFANPEIAIEFDVDQARAVETRKAVLAAAADEGLPVAGAHLPFPGIGKVRVAGPGSYAWIAQEFTPLH